jgi:hypothetical protein
MTPITHDKCSKYSIGNIPISVVLFSILGIEFSSFFDPRKFGKILRGFFLLAKNSTDFAISWKKTISRNFTSQKWGKKKKKKLIGNILWL